MLDGDALGCEWKLLAKDGIYVDNVGRFARRRVGVSRGRDVIPREPRIGGTRIRTHPRTQGEDDDASLARRRYDERNVSGPFRARFGPVSVFLPRAATPGLTFI